jgi:hypothetical protein
MICNCMKKYSEISSNKVMYREWEDTHQSLGTKVISSHWEQ